MVINYNPDPEDDILINSFKYEPEASESKVAIPIQRRRQKGIVVDKTQNIEKINYFWKRLAAGLESLSIEEVAYLGKFREPINSLRK
jgi:hypothetical protein